MGRRAWFLILLAGFTACGPAIRYVYSKPDVTTEQRTRDASECAALSSVSVPSGGYGTGYPGASAQQLRSGPRSIAPLARPG
jgi:hypothetical protein